MSALPWDPDRDDEVEPADVGPPLPFTWPPELDDEPEDG